MAQSRSGGLSVPVVHPDRKLSDVDFSLRLCSARWQEYKAFGKDIDAEREMTVIDRLLLERLTHMRRH